MPVLLSLAAFNGMILVSPTSCVAQDTAPSSPDKPATAIGLAYSNTWTASLGHPAPHFSLRSSDGTRVNSSAPDDRAVVLAFLSTGSKVTSQYIARIQKLHQTYSASGFRFLGIFSNVDETPEKVAAFGAENHLTFPLLLDRTGKTAYSYGITVTPEVWIVDYRGVAVYHGAIDDNATEERTRHSYLTDALEALIQDSHPPMPETHIRGDLLRRAGAIDANGSDGHSG